MIMLRRSTSQTRFLPASANLAYSSTAVCTQGNAVSEQVHAIAICLAVGGERQEWVADLHAVAGGGNLAIDGEGSGRLHIRGTALLDHSVKGGRHEGSHSSLWHLQASA